QSIRRHREGHRGPRAPARQARARAGRRFPWRGDPHGPARAGPPSGMPVQYRVSGPDVNEVRDVALRLAQGGSSDSRARRVNFDWMEPGRKVRIRVDQDQARLLGLSSQSIAAVLNTVMTGAPVTEVRDWIYLIDVLIRATDEQRVSLETLRNLQFAL